MQRICRDVSNSLPYSWRDMKPIFVKIIFSANMVVSNSLLLSSLVTKSNHTVMEVHRLNHWKCISSWDRLNYLSSLRKYILCSACLQAMSIWERTRILFLSYHPYNPFSYSFTQSESPDSYQVPVPLHSLMLELLTCFSYINYIVALRYWPTQLLLMHSFLLTFFPLHTVTYCPVIDHFPPFFVNRRTYMSNGHVSQSSQLFSRAKAIADFKCGVCPAQLP